MNTANFDVYTCTWLHHTRNCCHHNTSLLCLDGKVEIFKQGKFRYFSLFKEAYTHSLSIVTPLSSGKITTFTVSCLILTPHVQVHVLLVASFLVLYILPIQRISYFLKKHISFSEFSRSCQWVLHDTHNRSVWLWS